MTFKFLVGQHQPRLVLWEPRHFDFGHGAAFVANKRKNRILCVMTDERARLLADLEAIAALIQDPAKREEVQRIIARLSHRAQEWPDDAEMIRLRLKCSDSNN